MGSLIIMGTGQDFERAMVKALNGFFELSGTKAIAYRRPQTRYQPQLFDIFVDSRGSELYLAIECKQVDSDAYESIYFSSHFGKTKGVSQVQRESDLLDLCGRNGILAIESWSPSLRKRKAFLVPWRHVWYHFQRGDPNIPQSVITSCPTIYKSGGKYSIDHDDMISVIKSLDNPPRRIPRKWTKNINREMTV